MLVQEQFSCHKSNNTCLFVRFVHNISMNFNRLDSQTFTFGNYGFHIPLDVYFDKSSFINFIKNSVILGITENPSFKKREGTFAVLFVDADDNYNERWTHVPDFIIQAVENSDG